jgi:murein DD-endopeptidase MepM/ murein hydrolase activator NlpD
MAKKTTNGWRLFKNFVPYVTSPFGWRTHPITGKRSFHPGVDYGTHLKKIPQVALENGIVVSTGKDSTGALFVWVEYPRLGYRGLHYHLDSIAVKKGQAVKEGTVIGNTGTTGQSTGIHLHFGWRKIGSTIWEDFEKYVFPPFVVGTPLKRNKEMHQVEILVNNLNARDKAGLQGGVQGFIRKGIYNVKSISKVIDGYKWAQVENNLWVALQDNWNVILEPEKKPEPKPEPKPEGLKIGDKVKIIATGNGSSMGRSNTARGIGWIRYVTNIYPGRPFPYQIGNKGKTDSKNTTGFYPESSLRKV